MQIFIGNDHAATKLKNELLQLLTTEFPQLQVTNLGTDSSESVDYPDFGHAVAKRVVTTPNSRGIVICGTGIGIGIAANKVDGARCALCTHTTAAALARQHNDANILALGARMTGSQLAAEIVKTFLTTDFSGGRHACRVAKLEN